MTSDACNTDARTKEVSLKELYLDPNNYRLIHESDYVTVSEEKIKNKDAIQRTFRLLVGERNTNIQDLLDSFKANGYLPVDQIQVRTSSSGGYVVVEGNRRIAALKYLEQEYEQKGNDIGKLDPTIFERVPVVLFEDADEMHHLTLMGLKHISGNKKWGEWNQAKLLEKMHSTYGLAEEEIYRRIGISKQELNRSLRALGLVGQYRLSDYGDQFSESKFAIFREAVRNTSLKKWLGWDEAIYRATNVENGELFFSWLSAELIEDEDDDDDGKPKKYREPAIVKRDEIRILGGILGDARALEQFKISRDLYAAYRTSDLIFKERQAQAIKLVSDDVAVLNQLAISNEHLPNLENTLLRLQGIVNRTKGSGLSGVEQKSVFHDRIDEHFSELYIESYKKLTNLKLNKLARVNLFAGLNNSAKTTLLEAIYLLVRQNDFAGILEIIRRRGKVPEDQINPAWLIEQISDDIHISGRFDQQNTIVSIRSHHESDDSIDKSYYLGSVEIISKFGIYSQESQVRVFQGRERETQADFIKLLSQVVYSSPFFLNEPHHYSSFYHKSVQSKALPKIFDFIRKYIVPTLNDIRLVDELQRFLVDDSRYEITRDLTTYGEGLQRIFFISLLFASAQNGVVLIDEFENAIDVELIGKFTPFIHQLAIDFNVQVFLTSHSKECIDAFVKNVPKTEVDDFSFHTMVAKDNAVVVREYSGKRFYKLLDDMDIDLRRIR